MKGRTPLATALLVLSSGATLGCGTGARPESEAKGTEEIAASVLDRLPEDVAHRTFVDFGGKLHLVGYDVSPSTNAGPGDTIRLKLYWKPVSRLEPGWNLFTHLEDDRTHQLWNFDRQGAFRNFLGANMPIGLSVLEPGKVYVDEQTLTLPKAGDLAPYVVVVVGVWQGDMRLPVVSGATNGHEAAVIARLSTGIERLFPNRVHNTAPR